MTLRFAESEHRVGIEAKGARLYVDDFCAMRPSDMAENYDIYKTYTHDGELLVTWRLV